MTQLHIILAAIALIFLPLDRVIAQEAQSWFVFSPTDYFKSNTVDLTTWLDKPAGKHGFLQFKGKDYQFEDGTRTKFWGVNICSDEPFSDEAKVKQWVRLLTKYGINGVRFHKFTWDATDGIHSTKITDNHWKKFDRFNHELREAGIYYSWSHIYGHRVLPADSSRLLAYEEIKNTKFPWAHLNGTTASLVNFAEDLQELNIELTVNMLNHLNPLTGKKYADDPALAFVELQNEDNIYWGAIEETLKQTPTYKKLLSRKFSTWLKQKYATEAGLRKAWNNEGIESGESLDAENIYPHPNHGLFSYYYEEAVKKKKHVPRFIADRATFLFEEQNKFYQKFIREIRKTGYKGVIVGSCWQAGSGITHFYNLFSDYNAGVIDRHNYFGGNGSHVLKPGKFKNESMLSMPGSGLLSTGLQMVADRPFQISEWMSLIPTEWVAESAPLIAIYGMGLQGWDASYSFAMDYNHYTTTLQSGHGVYNVTSPLQLALYPALAAMIYRGDVREGKPIANRNINEADLQAGKLELLEKTSQQYDVKSFESSVPPETIAVGPVSLTFNQPQRKINGDLGVYWNQKTKRIRSVTSELEWDYSGKGYFTINTAGTQGLVGFAPDKSFDLKDFRLSTTNEFAVILITSLDPAKGIANADQILVTTVARAKNTGMTFDADKIELLSTGTAPLLIEPVTVTLDVRRKGTPTVHVLDHTGDKTNQTIKLTGNKIILDGNKYQTIYYLIEY